MHPDYAQRPVGELVAEKPARSRVFQRHRLDFCCGGKKPLAEACGERGIDLSVVLAELERADQDLSEETNPLAMSLTELVAHIEATHHAYLREELPRLERMIVKVAAVHGDAHPWMREVLVVYRELMQELLPHMEKEEQVLFPMIRIVESGRSASTPCGGGIQGPIHVMEMEHDHAGAALARLHELTSGYQPPAGACNTFRAALDGLRELEADMHQHVHKENNILFPRALAL